MYYLIDAPGWEVTYADRYATEEFTPNGEVRFGAGERTIALSWRPVDTHEDYVSARRNPATEETRATIDGTDATVLRYDGATNYTAFYTALWLTDEASMELRGVFDNRDDFLAIATALTRVDEDAWLTNLPDSVVAPE